MRSRKDRQVAPIVFPPCSDADALIQQQLRCHARSDT
jgi:hypothetical protein